MDFSTLSTFLTGVAVVGLGGGCVAREVRGPLLLAANSFEDPAANRRELAIGAIKLRPFPMA